MRTEETLPCTNTNSTRASPRGVRNAAARGLWGGSSISPAEFSHRTAPSLFRTCSFTLISRSKAKEYWERGTNGQRQHFFLSSPCFTIAPRVKHKKGVTHTHTPLFATIFFHVCDLGHTHTHTHTGREKWRRKAGVRAAPKWAYRYRARPFEQNRRKVDGDLVHQIAALDAHLLAGHEMLYDHVAHVLPERVPLAVQRVHGVERERVAAERPVLTADDLKHTKPTSNYASIF